MSVEVLGGGLRKVERRAEVRVGPAETAVKTWDVWLNRAVRCLFFPRSIRYFAEHIRDDYANGQLDAQVRSCRWLVSVTGHLGADSYATPGLFHQVENALAEIKELNIYGNM
jgi:hypothetical protein